MGKRKDRTILTPATATADFSRESPLTYWKQVLPQKRINYTTKSGKRASVLFDEKYLSKAISHFKNMDQTPFLLADKDNAHTMDPERYRADVTEMRLANPGEAPGLYAKLQFANKKAAKAVLENPKLGVSARIREEEDGPKIIHVLGTLDPQVTGMAPWQPADLSNGYDDNVLDLSRETYTEGKTVAKGNKKASEGREISDYTEEDIEEMTDEQVDAFLAEFAPDFEVDSDASETDDDTDDEDDEDEDSDTSDSDSRLVGAGAELSTKNKADIELANSAAAVANSRASEALRRMAAAEFRETRAAYIAEGVPAHLLDLAEPVLNRPDDMVIDLSNSGGEDDVNVSDIVRKMLDSAKGTIDLSEAQGNFGNFDKDSDNDPDAPMLDAWESQFGN